MGESIQFILDISKEAHEATKVKVSLQKCEFVRFRKIKERKATTVRNLRGEDRRIYNILKEYCDCLVRIKDGHFEILKMPPRNSKTQS